MRRHPLPVTAQTRSATAVDWIVLFAAVVGLGVAIASTVQGSLDGPGLSAPMIAAGPSGR